MPRLSARHRLRCLRLLGRSARIRGKTPELQGTRMKNYTRLICLAAHSIHRRLPGSDKLTIEATSARVGIRPRDVTKLLEEWESTRCCTLALQLLYKLKLC
ncbi:hypothetical protein VFPBJ_11176 [Purpureocillium lilacinum]|uniref:Uncharacterized protein n=1 Tax=Purpureocillium lilacinum TaxID=33203 RepID=A0A179FJE8_PURLI|nr:hypothetical protein VFPBJ_11176 [Purpureocillium lilacinum]